jgi:7-carboxy-7-deazaguanine synthase
MLVNEIFKSICGEGTELGQIAVFVRFTGCDMRCAYPCDTQYSFEGGERYTVEELVEKIKSFGVKRIFWTGGEPMLNEEGMREVVKLLPRCDGWFHILQTNGKHLVDPALLKSLDIVSIDFKGPSAGPQAISNEEVIRHALTEAYRATQIKFLVGDQADYDFAKEKIRQFSEDEHLADPFITYVIGPIGGLNMKELAEKVLADEYLGTHANVRVGAQVHKLLWGSRRGV